MSSDSKQAAQGEREGRAALSRASPQDLLPYRHRSAFNLFELACLLHGEDPERLSNALWDEWTARHRGMGNGKAFNRPELLRDAVDATPRLLLGDEHGGALATLKKATGRNAWGKVSRDEAQALAALLGLAHLLPGVVAAAPVVLAPTTAELVPAMVATAKASKATQAAEKVAREDGRLRECEARGIVFDRVSANRLPDGVGAVAKTLNITRQSLSTDLKAALRRRFDTARNGKG